ncbi:MAG: tyrosine-type recombinase/integrase [Proteobacteria bacterium]|nr:tyrosine-type recombinase/integrase [Pseudomonadota bacterium]
MALTNTAIRNAKPKGKPYKMADAGGLLVLIQPSGAKWWRLRYRFGGKEKMLSLGVYPEVSLTDARDARDAAKKQIKGGADPTTERKAEALAVTEEGDTFEKVALAWWQQWKAACTPGHADKTLVRLKTDVFPAIGKIPVKKLTAPMLLMMAKRIESRGALDIARRALQTSGQVLRYAVAHGLAERNPAADVKPSDALTPRKKQHFARLDEKELPELLRKINDYDGTTVTRCALRLMALTFVRTTELIGARWDEIDREANLWRIPAERMKMKTPHLVPLSKQALAVLEELRQETGGRELLFAGERNLRKPISNNTILYALYRMGYHSRMTGHGFRGIASTILHENGFSHEHIEIQLAHQERNQVSAAYNHATYVKQRAEMMQWWSDYLGRAATLGLVLPMKKQA